MALLPFVRFIMVSASLQIVFYVRLLFYSGMALLSLPMYVYVLKRHDKGKIDWLTVALLCVCGLSICFSPFHERFMAWERFGAFVLLLLVTGPLVLSPSLQDIRRRALTVICWLCVLCSVYYNGLYVFMLTHYCSWLSRWSFVWWHSINVSMLFSALCGVGSIYTGWLLLQLPAGKAYMLRRIIYLLSMLSSVNALILASSRTAIVAFAAGWLLMCALTWYRKKHVPVASGIMSVSLALVCGLTVLVPMTPIMNIKFNYIEQKDDDYFASRRTLWEEREKEIISSRFFGTGFACVNPDSERSCNGIVPEHNKSYNVEPGNGLIEPGSGWMYLLSSLGWPGLIIFIAMLLRRFAAVLPRGILMPGLLLYFSLHMFTEGYVLSSGAMMAFILWLTMSVSTPCGRTEETGGLMLRGTVYG